MQQHQRYTHVQEDVWKRNVRLQGPRKFSIVARPRQRHAQREVNPPRRVEYQRKHDEQRVAQSLPLCVFREFRRLEPVVGGIVEEHDDGSVAEVRDHVGSRKKNNGKEVMDELL